MSVFIQRTHVFGLGIPSLCQASCRCYVNERWLGMDFMLKSCTFMSILDLGYFLTFLNWPNTSSYSPIIISICYSIASCMRYMLISSPCGRLSQWPGFKSLYQQLNEFRAPGFRNFRFVITISEKTQVQVALHVDRPQSLEEVAMATGRGAIIRRY